MEAEERERHAERQIKNKTGNRKKEIHREKRN